MHHILCSHTTHRIGSVGNSWKERSGLLFLVFGQLSAAHQAQCVFSKYYPSSLLPTPTHMCSCLPCLSFRYQRRSVYGQNPEEKSLASIEARCTRALVHNFQRERTHVILSRSDCQGAFLVVASLVVEPWQLFVYSMAASLATILPAQ